MTVRATYVGRGHWLARAVDRNQKPPPVGTTQTRSAASEFGAWAERWLSGPQTLFGEPNCRSSASRGGPLRQQTHRPTHDRHLCPERLIRERQPYYRKRGPPPGPRLPGPAERTGAGGPPMQPPTGGDTRDALREEARSLSGKGDRLSSPLDEHRHEHPSVRKMESRHGVRFRRVRRRHESGARRAADSDRRPQRYRPPTAPWVWRQLLEATPWGQQPRYLIRDRDRSYGGAFIYKARAIGIKTVLTAVRAPKANAIAERVSERSGANVSTS